MSPACFRKGPPPQAGCPASGGPLPPEMLLRRPVAPKGEIRGENASPVPPIGAAMVVMFAAGLLAGAGIFAIVGRLIFFNEGCL